MGGNSQIEINGHIWIRTENQTVVGKTYNEDYVRAHGGDPRTIENLEKTYTNVPDE